MSQAMDEFAASRRLPIPPPVLRALKERYLAARADDAETIATIARVYKENGIIIDPHTAVGLVAAEKLGGELKGPVVALATAHPAKFPPAVTEAIGKPAELPPHLRDLSTREERYTVLANAKGAVEEFIMERIKKT
jgi:threonine synthase